MGVLSDDLHDKSEIMFYKIEDNVAYLQASIFFGCLVHCN